MYDFIEEDFHYKHDPRVVKLRGFIISKAIAVEEVINNMLVFHHEKDFKKGYEYQDGMLQEMSWNKKIKLLKRVLADYDFEKLVEGDERRDNLFVILERIINVRHMMAHHRWSRVWEDGVHLKKYKLQSEFHLSEEVVRKYIQDCAQATNVVNSMLEKAGFWHNLIGQLVIKKDDK